MLLGFPGVYFQLEPLKIKNIIGNVEVSLRPGQQLDLQRFCSNCFCTYQLNMFPGLIYRPLDLPILLLIFFSGKIVIMDVKSMADVYGGWLLKEYTDTLPPHLLQSLCSANITETDIDVIKTKMQEHTSSQIM